MGCVHFSTSQRHLKLNAALPGITDCRRDQIHKLSFQVFGTAATYVSTCPSNHIFLYKIQIAEQQYHFVSVIYLSPLSILGAEIQTEWVSQRMFTSRESGFPSNCNHGKCFTKLSSLCMLTFSCDICRNVVASWFARTTHSWGWDFAHLAPAAYALSLPQNDVFFPQSFMDLFLL